MKIQSAKAGIGTGRAGLQAASGLFSSAGLFDKGVKSFNPLDLDPYLLFDAETSMIGTLENPTLDLDPSKQDTLNVITATRAGTATFTDANGLIAQAPANTVRVDQTQGAELTPTKFQNIGYTDFSSGLVLSNFGTGVAPVLSSDALGSPNGTEDAYKIVFNAGSGTTSGNGSEVYFNVSEIEDNIQSTASIFLRGENGGEQLVFRGATNGSYQLVTLTTEWQRFTTTENTSPSGNQKFTFGIRQSVSGHGVINSAATVYAYGPQLEEGTTASDFVANTTGSPKFITGPTFGPRVPMILVEPSSENFLLYSEDFSQSPWIKNGTSSVSSNTTISPDGTLNASTISNATGTSTSDTVFLSINPADVDHTFSVYVKSAGATTMSLFMRSGVTGVILSQAISLTDEWQRVTLTHNIQNGQLILGNSDGDFHVWGAQFETGSVATSYIPTSGSTVTRAADDLVISGSAFSDFYNQSEGTFYVESNTRLSDGVPFVVEADNGTNNRIALYYESNEVRGFLKSGGVTDANPIFGNRPTAGNLSRTAFSYKTNDFEGSVDGGSVVVDTSATIPTTINRFHLGSRFGQSDTHKLNGHIKRVLFWPYSSENL